jgi:hypothetical protein
MEVEVSLMVLQAALPNALRFAETSFVTEMWWSSPLGQGEKSQGKKTVTRDDDHDNNNIIIIIIIIIQFFILTC